MLARIWAAFVARNIEFYRDKSALIWSLVFPLALLLGLSFAFDDTENTRYKISILGPASSASDWVRPETAKYVQWLEAIDLDSAMTRLKNHQIDLLLDPGQKIYWVNHNSPQSEIAELILRGADERLGEFRRESLAIPPIEYSSWVIPGILAMNLMFSSLFGMGYVLVTHRKNGVLRRLKATPLRIWEFVLAQVVSRLVITLGTAAIVLVGCVIILDVRMIGNFLDLFVIYALGATCMTGLGFIVAARSKSKEMTDGVLNLITWPMLLGSGIWFSLEGTNPAFQFFAKCLPLTYVVDAMRSVMLHGIGLSELLMPVAILAALSFLFFAIGSLMFRWE